MQPELLFFVVIIIWRIAFRNRSEVISYFRDLIYLAWFLCSISNFDYTPSVLQYGIRLLSIVCGLLAVFRNGTVKLIVPRKSSAATIFIIYILFCGVATIWSVDPLQTAVKVVELVIDVMLILKAIEIDRTDVAIKKLVKVLVVSCVLVEFYSLAGFIVMNGTFFHDKAGIIGKQLTGVIVSSDALCESMVLVICYYLNFKKGFRDNLILALAFIILLLGQARTAIACAVIVLLIYFFRSNRKVFYTFALAVACVAVYFNWDLIYAYLVRGESDENLQNLTGRRVMWEWAKELIAEKPLFGYGFGSGGELVSMRIGMSTLHSGIYESIIGVGYIGFAQLLLTYVIAVLKIVIDTLKRGISENMYEIMLLIHLSVYTYMGVGIGGWQSVTMMFFLVVIFSLSFEGNLETLTMQCESKNAEES